MQYPERVIKMGEKDATIVKALKQQLNEALVIGDDSNLKLDVTDASFGTKMKLAVKTFQARNVDATGRTLKQDGEVGMLTWEVLFGEDTVVPKSAVASDDFLACVLHIAAGEEAKLVREEPPRSNRGSEIDEYLNRAGASVGLSWCCAFVYWCFDEAAKKMHRKNPMFKTPGCLDHWNHALSKGAYRILTKQAINNPAIVKPGMIFIIDHGKGLGHTGLVEKINGGWITTIEGNTNAGKSREGGGVCRLTRKLSEINKGFIDYTGL